jgi:hypothetical protein
VYTAGGDIVQYPYNAFPHIHRRIFAFLFDVIQHVRSPAVLHPIRSIARRIFDNLHHDMFGFNHEWI